MMKSMPSGLEFVSTIPNTGMPRRLASLTAMFSFITSTTKSAEGRRLRSAMLPRFFSSLARWGVICSSSRFERLENVPSFIMRSMLTILLTALRIVGKFTLVAFSAMISLACFLVETNNIFFPDFAICFRASAASSIFATVLCRSMM